MKDETLLPCPFCGGEPEEEGGTFVEYHGHERQDYSITCKQCGAEVRCDVGDFEGADAFCSCHHDTRKICADKWNSRALQYGNSAQPVKVPAGYVLVPVEPTQGMCDVGHIGIDVLTGVTSDSEYYSTWGDSAAKLYRAMLSAAPKVTGNQLTPALGWTDNSDANAALVMLDRIDTLDLADDDRIEEVKQIIRSLAAPTAPDGWIPVSERMPEVGSTVMVFMDKPSQSSTDYAIATFDKYGFSRAKVTHWQPLPDAPKGGVR